MTVLHEINIDPIIEALIVSDDLPAILRPLDACTRSAIRLDAIFNLADAVLFDDRAEIGFYGEIISVLDSLLPLKKTELRRRDPVSVEAMYRVPDVAQRLGMSENWVRRHFEKIEGVKTITSPRRRGKREYSIC
ncbi:MAG TPA: hypothetical protein VKV15_18585 [Bryobacteraceae bacterium]|nr:hypothetical protein [Bryobacteraceae bacterium]